jgi:DNA-binding NarL/FixJ family response regulator
VNVIIVDDEQAGRRTLREFCEAEGDLQVVGEYGDGETALAEIRASGRNSCFSTFRWIR